MSEDNIKSQKTVKKQSSTPLSWFNNVAKSLGYASTELVTQLIPTSIAITTSNADVVKDIYTDLKDFKTQGNRINSWVKNNKQLSIGKLALQNAIEDIKSGKIYNKERQEALYETDDFDIDGFSFDDTFSDDSFDMSDIGDEPDTDVETLSEAIDDDSNVVLNKKVNNFNAINNNKIADSNPQLVSAINSQTQVIANTNQALNDTMVGTFNASLLINQRYSNSVLDGISAINGNLSTLVNFQSISVTKYISSSLKYYEESLNVLNETLGVLKSSNSSDEEENNNRPKKQQITSDDLFTDGFSIASYGELLKTNLSNTISSNAFLAPMKMIFDDVDTLSFMAASPLSFITNNIIKKFIPELLRTTMESFDNTLANFFPALLMKIGDLSNSSNPMLQVIGEIFGYRAKSKTSADLSLYKKGPVPFDGITKTAITDVIPSYLRKILAVLSGTQEMGYDYQKREFKSVAELEKNFKEERSRVLNAPFRENISAITEQLDAFEFDDEKFKQKYVEEVGKFFNSLANSNRFVDFEKDKDAIRDIYTFSNNTYQNMFEAMVGNLSNDKKLNMFGRSIMEAREKQRAFFEEIEQNPELHGYSSIYNGMEVDHHMTKATDDKPSEVRKEFKLGSVDKFKMNSLDYLRRITTMLSKGILVHVKSGLLGNSEEGEEVVNPNAKMLEKLKKQKEDYDKDNNKRLSKKYRTFSKAQRKQLENEGKTVIDVYKTSDLSKNEIAERIKNYQKIKQESGKEKDKDDIGDYISKKLGLKSVEKQEKFNSIKDVVQEAINKPAQIIKSVFTKLDNTLYNIIFGGQDKNEVSFFKKTFVMLQDNVLKFGSWMKKSFFDPIYDKLFGEKNGFFTKLKEKESYQKVKEKSKAVRDYLFGNKETETRGLFQDTGDAIKDTFKAIGFQFTGKGYTTSKGEKVETDKENSIFGQVSSTFKAIGRDTSDYLFGKKDKDTGKRTSNGIITNFTEGLSASFDSFRYSLFGKSSKSSESQADDSINELTTKVKKAFPKAAAYGLIGAGVGTLMLGSGAGLLGSLVLPGGPLGYAILGMTGGMLSQSEKFNTWLFGAKDINGNRLGGLIGKSTIEFFKKNKSAMVGGAVLGSIKPMLGFGFLPSFFLPGGIVGGALMGVATALLYRSNMVQDLLFGKKDISGERAGGIFTKLYSKTAEHKKIFGGAALGAGAGIGVSAVVGQMGLLGSLLTPGGIIGGAILGAATGIALSTKKWNKAVFGEWDEETGKRDGGLLGKFQNWFSMEVTQPLKLKMQEVNLNIKEWFTKSIANPFKDALVPIKAEFSYLVEGMKSMFYGAWDSFKGFLANTFENFVGAPFGEFMDKYVMKPLKGFVDKTTGFVTKIFKAIVTAPIKLLSSFSDGLIDKHKRRGLKYARKDAKEKMKTNPVAGTVDYLGTIVNPVARRKAMLGENGAYYLKDLKADKKARDKEQKEEFASRRQEINDKKEELRGRRDRAKNLEYENFVPIINKDGVTVKQDVSSAYEDPYRNRAEEEVEEGPTVVMESDNNGDEKPVDDKSKKESPLVNIPVLGKLVSLFTKPDEEGKEEKPAVVSKTDKTEGSKKESPLANIPVLGDNNSSDKQDNKETPTIVGVPNTNLYPSVFNTPQSNNPINNLIPTHHVDKDEDEGVEIETLKDIKDILQNPPQTKADEDISSIRSLMNNIWDLLKNNNPFSKDNRNKDIESEDSVSISIGDEDNNVEKESKTHNNIFSKIHEGILNLNESFKKLLPSEKTTESVIDAEYYPKENDNIPVQIATPKNIQTTDELETTVSVVDNSQHEEDEQSTSSIYKVDYIKRIYESVDGQLDGVGRNVYKIRKMLNIHFGIPDDSIEGSANKDRIGFFGKLRRFFLRPFETIFNWIKKPFKVVKNLIDKGVEKVKKAVHAIVQIPKKIIKGVGVVFNFALKGLKTLYSGAKTVLGGIGKTIGFVVKDVALPAIANITDGVTRMIGGAIAGVGKLFGSILGASGKVLEGVVKLGVKVGDVALNLMQNIGNVAANLVGGIGKVIASSVKGIAKLGASVIEGVADVASNVIKIGAKAISGLAKTAFNILTSPFKIIGRLIGGSITKNVTTVKGGYIDEVKSVSFTGLRPIIGDGIGDLFYKGGLPVYIIGSDGTIRVQNVDGGIGGDDETSSGENPVGGFVKGFMDNIKNPTNLFKPTNNKDDKDASKKDSKKPSSVDGDLTQKEVSSSDNVKTLLPKKKPNKESKEVDSSPGLLSKLTSKIPGASLISKIAGGVHEKASKVTTGIKNIKSGISEGVTTAFNKVKSFSKKEEAGKHVRRKTAEYLIGLNDDARKEALDAEWKTEVLSAINRVGDINSEHTSTWKRMFGPKGLFAMGLLMLLPKLKDLLKSFKQELLGGEDRTPTTTDEVIENTDLEHAMKRGKIKGLQNVLKKLYKFFPDFGKMTLKEVGESIVDAGKKTVSKTVSFTKKTGNRILDGATKLKDKTVDVSKKLIDKVPGGTKFVENTSTKLSKVKNSAVSLGENVIEKSKTLGNKIKDFGSKDNLSKIGKNAIESVKDKITKVNPNITPIMESKKESFKNFVKIAKEAIEKVVSYLSKKLDNPAVNKISAKLVSIFDNVIAKNTNTIIKKLGKKITKGMSKMSLSASTSFVADAVFAIYGGLNGACNPERVFKVSEDEVDGTMRFIAAGIRAALEVSYAFIIEIVNEICIEFTDIDFIQMLANLLYKVMAGKEKYAKLKESQAEFKDEVETYNKMTGSKLSVDAYNDMQNRTILQKWVTDPLKGVWKNIVGGKDEEVTIDKETGVMTSTTKEKKNLLQTIGGWFGGTKEKTTEINSIGKNVTIVEDKGNALQRLGRMIFGGETNLEVTDNITGETSKQVRKENNLIDKLLGKGKYKEVGGFGIGDEESDKKSKSKKSKKKKKKDEDKDEGFTITEPSDKKKSKSKKSKKKKKKDEDKDEGFTIVEPDDKKKTKKSKKKKKKKDDDKEKDVSVVGYEDDDSLGYGSSDIATAFLQDTESIWTEIHDTIMYDIFGGISEFFDKQVKNVGKWANNIWDLVATPVSIMMENVGDIFEANATNSLKTPTIKRINTKKITATAKKSSKSSSKKTTNSKTNIFSKTYNNVKKWFGGFGEGDGGPINESPEPVVTAKFKPIRDNFRLPKRESFSKNVNVSKIPGGGYNGTTDKEQSVDKVQNFAYYAQSDPRWGSYPYKYSNGGSPKNPGIAYRGCGPTSLAMVLTNLTGKRYFPNQIAQYSIDNGYSVEGGTSWGLFTKAGKDWDMTVTETGTSTSRIIQELQAGRPLVLSGQAPRKDPDSPFTTGGHLVTAVGTNGSDKILINDPRGVSYSKAYSVDKVKQGLLNSWSYKYNNSGKQLPTPGSTSSFDSSGTTGTPGATTEDGATTTQAKSSAKDIMSVVGENFGILFNNVLFGKDDPFTFDDYINGTSSDVTTTDGTASPDGGASVNGNYKYDGKIFYVDDSFKIGTTPLGDAYNQYNTAFNNAGAKYNVEPALLKAISRQESGGNVKSGYPNGAAWGLMQIENTLKSEFAEFGKQTTGTAFTLEDRLDPNKAIPFGAKRFAEDLAHYKGDYLKAIQAYNFSKYSLDTLIKKYGDNWINNTHNIAYTNGHYNRTGSSKYGDPQYIPHVLRYYHGNIIKNKSKGAGNGGFGLGEKPEKLKTLDELRREGVKIGGGFGEGPKVSSKISRIFNRSKNYNESIPKVSFERKDNIPGGFGEGDKPAKKENILTKLKNKLTPKKFKDSYDKPTIKANMNIKTNKEVGGFGETSNSTTITNNNVSRSNRTESVVNNNILPKLENSLDNQTQEVRNFINANKNTYVVNNDNTSLLKEAVGILRHISGNTDSISKDTKIISDKDMTVINQTTEGDVYNSVNNTNPTLVKPGSSPNMLNMGADKKRQRNYSIAKKIAGGR